MGKSIRSRVGLGFLSAVAPLCVFFLLASLVFSTQSAQQRGAVKLANPIAIDRGGSTDIFVLDARGTVHRLQETSNSLTQLSSFQLPGLPQVADMAYYSSGSEQSLVIAGVELNRGFVWQYSLDGHNLQTWPLRNIGAGLVSSEANHCVYLATSDSNEIYQLTLDDRKISYISQIPGARKLGPLAIDDGSHTLFVGDIDGGAVYEYSLSEKSTKLLVSGLVVPSALYFDQQSGRLYVADAARGKVLSVDTRSKKPILIDIVSAPLKSPTGVSLLLGGGLAVTDLAANAVYLFSDQGKLLSRFPN